MMSAAKSVARSSPGFLGDWTMPPQPQDAPANKPKHGVGADFRAGAWACALVFCATLAAYFPAYQGGFVWDDAAHVTRPDLQSLAGLGRIWFQMGATQQYYPVLHSAFWLEHRLWGDSPLGYHVWNVLLHATAACLLGLALRRVFAAPARALVPEGTEWLAALIFALHPVCVESVAWISEQKNTLSVVFYLGSALVYLQGRERERRSYYWAALALFVLALLTKTVTATLPAALLVALWWRDGRLEARRDVVPLLPWLAIGVTGGLLTAWVERSVIGAQGSDFSLNLLERGLLAGRVIWFYLGKIVWPADLIFIYPRWTIDATAWWQYLFPAATLALVLGLWFVARRDQGPAARPAAAGLAGFLIFAGTLFPALGFFNVYPFRFSYVADHFQYLASVGPLVLIAAGLAFLAGRAGPGRWPLALAGALPGLILGGLTWHQCEIYRDAETLYRETLARNPACWMAHNNLGLIWSDWPGRLDDAIAQYQEALRLKPDYAEAHNNLGNVWARTPGKLNDAIAEFEQALRVLPDFAEAHNNLGNVLARTPGRLEDAIAHYQVALRLKWNGAVVHYNLGNALASTPGRLSEATAEFQEALRQQPDYVEAHIGLGIVWARTPGRMEDAIAQFQEALRLNPGSVQAHYNLANAWSRMPGRLNGAIAHYQEAVRLQPGFVPAWHNLGVSFMQLGNRPAAAAAFEEALRRAPNDPAMRQELAAALRQARGE
jgi:tetratricopeptide (TPR) repeat protein